ncbi:MAG: pyruvate dehydrogenase (acetyl-transferring), homodimeric type, partial [Pirellulaceae bacterium]|nr:pyruvate dehydrogenase (acetyl-transferring), homodimeric type [Pirellulaceae bacterium]
VPTYEDYRKMIERDYNKTMSTTMGFVRLLSRLCRDKMIGKNIVPIVPDESRTFGMEGMFREVGIYSHVGQLYEPVDSGQLTPYKEAKDGQLLEEGISEAGSLASFSAAGTAYAAHGVNMIPFYIYYSMFGFQRVGDSIWAAADMGAKGFLIGGTAGRTTLNGEGLQHQDGHSLLNASAYPFVRSFDPSFHYETAFIIFDGLRRLYKEGETAIYYIMAENANYEMLPMPEGAESGICKGLYKFRDVQVDGGKHTVQLFGSGAIMQCVLKAQEILAEKYGVSSSVWSATSYTELTRDAQVAARWNRLHPTSKDKKTSYLASLMQGVEGPVVAASDYVRAYMEQIREYMPNDYLVLGTDGLGRSDTRETLRRHFEVDAESIVIGALHQLAKQGSMKDSDVAKAIKDLDYDPEKINPLYA